jgi:hypothetical protein
MHAVFSKFCVRFQLGCGKTICAPICDRIVDALIVMIWQYWYNIPCEMVISFHHRSDSPGSLDMEGTITYVYVYTETNLKGKII